jgi:hypothetical protein
VEVSMRVIPTWLTISMLVGVFMWGCYEHDRREAAEQALAAAPVADDDSDDDSEDVAEPEVDDSSGDEDAVEDNDESDDSDDDAKTVTIVKISTNVRREVHVTHAQ